MAELHLWMNGLHVGVWSVQRGGTSVLRYFPSWRDSPQGRPLSLSLSFNASLEHRGEVVDHYFQNLLPDSHVIRARLKARFATPSEDPFDLLAAVGRDCVGALQILPPEQGPDGWNRIEAEPLDEFAVARVLLTATSRRGPAWDDEADDLRVSLAGAQEKTALLRMGKTWYLPRGATPTTHILKLPLGLVGNLKADMTESVENEWLCAQLLAALGLPVARTEMARFSTTKALVVERFDRRWQGPSPNAGQPEGEWLLRLPQEDFCQALGVTPELKYQSDGGPTLQQCLALLLNNASTGDASVFLLAQLAFWLMAATDGHAKNFSHFLQANGRTAMTPLYDVLSVWPIIGNGANQITYNRAKLAMGIKSRNMHYRLSEITARHWHGLAMQAGAGAWTRMLELARRVPAALDQVEPRLPADFPASTWRPIASGTRRHAAQFLEDARSVSAKTG